MNPDDIEITFDNKHATMRELLDKWQQQVKPKKSAAEDLRRKQIYECVKAHMDEVEILLRERFPEDFV